MEQLKLFIEKAKTDSDLTAKLDALGVNKYEGDINGERKAIRGLKI